MITSDKIALFSLIVAGLSLVLTIVTIKQTRKHNRLSAKPILQFIIEDFTDHIKILIKNSGTGPLIRQKLICTYNETTSNHLIDLMPKHETIKWENYSKFDIMVIVSNDYETLIELKRDENNKDKFDEYAKEVRNVLKDIKLTCYYKDIYGNDFKVEDFDLNYCFKRHSENK